MVHVGEAPVRFLHDLYTTCTRLVHDVLHDGFLAEDDGLKMVDCLLQVPAAVRKTNELCIKNE